MRPRILLGLMSVLLPVSGCPAEPTQPPATLDALVDAHAGKLVRDKFVAGAALGIIRDGEATTYYLGVENRDSGKATSAETLYEIGSITKVFTGTILAAMELEGKANKDDLLKAYLPDSVTVPSKEGREITLLDLATHRSGLPRLPDNGSFASADPYADYTVDKLYAFLSSHQLRRTPGAEYEYSNYAVGLLGHALARRAGMSYEALLQERICGPLGMTDTVVKLSDAQRARMAQGYALTLDLGFLRVLSKEPNWNWDVLEGAGALRSGLPDMMKFLTAAMGAEGPLKDAFAVSQQPYFPFAENNAVGLNWHLSTSPDTARTLIWHNGGTAGYHCFMGFHAGTKNGIVLLANGDTPDAAAVAILDGLYSFRQPPVSERIE